MFGTALKNYNWSLTSPTLKMSGFYASCINNICLRILIEQKEELKFLILLPDGKFEQKFPITEYELDEIKNFLEHTEDHINKFKNRFSAFPIQHTRIINSIMDLSLNE